MNFISFFIYAKSSNIVHNSLYNKDRFNEKEKYI